MKAHAGSGGAGCLVLWLGEGRKDGAVVVRTGEDDLHWRIYCNDVDVEAAGNVATVRFEGETFTFPCTTLPPGATTGDAMRATFALGRGTA